MRKLIPLRIFSIYTAPHITGEEASKEHVKLSPHAAFETCLKQFTGGGSGASVFLVKLKENHPMLGESWGLKTGDTVVLKVGIESFKKRIDDDLAFFIQMQQENPNLLSLFASLYETSTPNDGNSNKSYYYMENLGNERLSDWINNAKGTPEDCLVFFQRILEHFFDHTTWFDIEDPKAARDAELQGRILTRLTQLLEDPDVSTLLKQEPLCLIQGSQQILHKNPLQWLQKLAVDSDPATIWKRDMLNFYTGTSLPSDTTTLNAMIVGDDVRLIDPGRLCKKSPMVGFSKLLSNFSRFLQSILGLQMSITASASGLKMVLHHSEETRLYNNAVFSETHALLEKITSTETFRTRNPFYKIILYTFSGFQFGADMIYRTEKNQKLADLYFFTRYCTWINTVLTRLYLLLHELIPVLNKDTVMTHSELIQKQVNVILKHYPPPQFDYAAPTRP